MPASILPPGDKPTRVVLGDNHFVRVTAAQTGGLYEMFEQVNAPGVGVPFHVHENEDETFHVIAGKVEYKLADRTILAEPGTTVFLPRRVPHAFHFVAGAPGRVMVTVSPATLGPMFDELAALPAGPPDMNTVIAICGRFGVRLA
ncbi:MAG: cupin domain-containing protein [Planctomycetota bacterium]|nr:cupin domain-containing protein [Planctomycetota bacterium]